MSKKKNGYQIFPQNVSGKYINVNAFKVSASFLHVRNCSCIAWQTKFLCKNDQRSSAMKLFTYS